MDLGLRKKGVQITWEGKGGMLWRELRVVLNRMVTRGSSPDVLVIHLGENDLVKEKGLSIMKEMKENMKEVARSWAGTFMMWT